MLQFTGSERKVLVLIGVLLIAGLAMRYYWPGKGEIQIEPAGGQPTAQEQVEEEAAPEEPEIAVHVTGAVVSPGVYFLPDGSRAYEAVELAGGPLEEADVELVNLAQPLYDGQQLFIPCKEEAAEPGAGGAFPSSPSGKININTASAAELEALPGIGEVRARSIVQYREEKGFFTSVEELTEVSGIGPKTLENVRELITVY